MESSEHKNIIQTIVESESFQNKEVLKGLLAFLFKFFEKGKQIKEMDIAIDYFKRDDKFIPGDDTIVRVNIHKLRQLLERYYSEEGKNDKIKVEIPKGSYSLKFYSKSDYKKENGKIYGNTIVLLVLLILSVVINIVFFINPIKNDNLTQHPVWNDYTNSYRPVCVILGDPFFYTFDDSLKSHNAFRQVTINSVEDLKKGGLLKAKKLDYPYYSNNNVLPLPDILPTLSKNKKEVKLQALSELNVDDIKKSNQVFIGNINSFGIFGQFLEKSSIRISNHPRKIILQKESDSIIYEVPEVVEGYYIDYAFLVKVPGPNSNIITMLGDFHGSGNKGLSGILNDEEKLKSLENSVMERFAEFPRYFEMVVKVSSFHYSDFKTEIIYFEKLNFEEDDKMYIPEMMY